jgi:hypothetical protein
MPDEPEIKQELAHASVQELVDELLSRCESAVVILERAQPIADPTENDSGPGTWWRKGSWFATMGMVNSVHGFLMVEMIQAREEAE